jgi:hypothetical protein
MGGAYIMSRTLAGTLLFLQRAPRSVRESNQASTGRKEGKRSGISMRIPGVFPLLTANERSRRNRMLAQPQQTRTSRPSLGRRFPASSGRARDNASRECSQEAHLLAGCLAAETSVSSTGRGACLSSVMVAAACCMLSRLRDGAAYTPRTARDESAATGPACRVLLKVMGAMKADTVVEASSTAATAIDRPAILSTL